MILVHRSAGGGGGGGGGGTDAHKDMDTSGQMHTDSVRATQAATSHQPPAHVIILHAPNCHSMTGLALHLVSVCHCSVTCPPVQPHLTKEVQRDRDIESKSNRQ